jgi:hypothetical protein
MSEIYLSRGLAFLNPGQLIHSNRTNILLVGLSLKKHLGWSSKTQSGHHLSTQTHLQKISPSILYLLPLFKVN